MTLQRLALLSHFLQFTLLSQQEAYRMQSILYGEHELSTIPTTYVWLSQVDHVPSQQQVE